MNEQINNHISKLVLCISFFLFSLGKGCRWGCAFLEVPSWGCVSPIEGSLRGQFNSPSTPLVDIDVLKMVCSFKWWIVFCTPSTGPITWIVHHQVHSTLSITIGPLTALQVDPPRGVHTFYKSCKILFYKLQVILFNLQKQDPLRISSLISAPEHYPLHSLFFQKIYTVHYVI